MGWRADARFSADYEKAVPRAFLRSMAEQQSMLGVWYEWPVGPVQEHGTMTAKNVNWKKAHRLFSAGVLTNTEIARQCGVTEATIRHHARTKGWKRDLSARVRARTGEKHILALAGRDEISNQPPRTEEDDEETVEQAALTQVAVVRHHSVAIRNGLDITQRLMHELDVTTTKTGELSAMLASKKKAEQRQGAERAISLPGRAAVMRDLAQAARLWINLERQAFRISDDRSREMPSAINEMTEEQLRASILEDLVILGIEPPKMIAAPKASGVVPKKG